MKLRQKMFYMANVNVDAEVETHATSAPVLDDFRSPSPAGESQLSGHSSSGLKRSKAISKTSRPTSLKKSQTVSSHGTSLSIERLEDRERDLAEAKPLELQAEATMLPKPVDVGEPAKYDDSERAVNISPPNPSPSPKLKAAAKGLTISTTPVLTPKRPVVQRRTSSPLKHEYAPSSPSVTDSSSGSECGSDCSCSLRTCSDPDCSCSGSSHSGSESGEDLDHIHDHHDDGDQHEHEHKHDRHDHHHELSLKAKKQELLEKRDFPDPLLEIRSSTGIQRKPSVVSLAKSVSSLAETAIPEPVVVVPAPPPFNAICFVSRWAGIEYVRIHNEPLRVAIHKGRFELFEPPHMFPPMFHTPTMTSSTPSGQNLAGPNVQSVHLNMNRPTPKYVLSLTPHVRLETRNSIVDCFVSGLVDAGTLGPNLLFRCPTMPDRDAVLRAFLRALPPKPQPPPSSPGFPSGSSDESLQETIRQEARASGPIRRGWNAIGRSRSFRSSPSAKPSIASSGGSAKSFASLMSLWRKRPFLNSDRTSSHGTGSGEDFHYKPFEFKVEGIGAPMLKAMKVALYRKAGPGMKWENMGRGYLGVFAAPYPAEGMKRLIVQNKKQQILFDICSEKNNFEKMQSKGVAVQVNERVLGEEIGRGSGTRVTHYCFKLDLDREAAFLLNVLRST